MHSVYDTYSAIFKYANSQKENCPFSKHWETTEY